MRRALAALVFAAATAGAFAPDGHATRECDGLEVCIRVPGPWVAIPAPTSKVRAPSVLYQLSCPRRAVVGGLDAVRTDRDIEVVFLGKLGSPVNPGITTERRVLFSATYTGPARRATAFRPLIGCVPTAGGGGRRTTGVAARAPAQLELRRVRNVKVGRGRVATGSVACDARQRLLASAHVVAFRARAAPSASVLAGVRVTRTERGRRVVVRARRLASVPRSVRVEVQVHALCGRRS